MYGLGSVMVRGSASWNHKSDLVMVDGNMNGQRYINEELQPKRYHLLEGYLTGQCMCAHSMHTTSLSTLSQDQNVKTLHSPARNADMSPMEHVWDILECNVRSRHQVNTYQQIIAALSRNGTLYLIWTRSIIRIIIGLVRRPCTAFVRADDSHTGT